MAEKLILEKGASQDRFLSSKPKIYIDVCQYLDEQSHVALVAAKEDKTDRLYKIR